MGRRMHRGAVGKLRMSFELAQSKNGRRVMNRVQWLQEEEIKRLEAMLKIEVEPSRQEVRAEVQRVRKQKAE